MKSIVNILILNFIFCLFNNSNAQNSFSIDTTDYIFDIKENNHFLSVSIIDDGFVLREHENTGNTIWIDTIFLTSNFPDKSIDWIERFNNSNEFVICAKNCKNLNYSLEASDTCTYYFSKYNSITQNLEKEISDTLYNEYFHPMPYRDSSIFLSGRDNIFLNGSFQTRRITLSLNKNLELTQIAPADSMQVYDYYGGINNFNDTIYRLETTSYIVSLFKYTTSISNFALIQTNIPNTDELAHCQYEEILALDSILVFYQQYSHANRPIKEWILAFYDFDLNLLKIARIPAPEEDIEVGQYKIILNKAQQLLYVTTKKYIYVMDFDLNIVCKIFLNNNSSVQTNLYEINDLTYKTNNQIDFFNIYCSYASLEDKNENQVEIFPNPFEKNLNFKNPESWKLKLKIFNLDHKLIYEVNSSNNDNTINLEHLQSGIYFISINNGISEVTKKITKI